MVSSPAAITQTLEQRSNAELNAECVEILRRAQAIRANPGRDSPWNASSPAAITQTPGQRLALECVRSPATSTQTLGQRLPWNASNPAAITQTLGGLALNASSPAAITQTLGRDSSWECVESCGHHAQILGQRLALECVRVLQPSRKSLGQRLALEYVESPSHHQTPGASVSHKPRISPCFIHHCVTQISFFSIFAASATTRYIYFPIEHRCLVTTPGSEGSVGLLDPVAAIGALPYFVGRNEPGQSANEGISDY